VADEKKSSMTKDEALELLRGGEEGVKEFNERRAAEDWAPIDLSNANLSKADLRQADLRQADLRQADLRQADLRQADLRQADLSKADLVGAHLSEANLSKADLRQADLSKADLVGAHLSEANLSKADLSEAALWFANLNEANLSEANLSRALLGAAKLSGADLQDANLTHVHGLVLDGQPTRGARFSPNAPDPWSVLRRQYTGPLMFINLALLVGFLAPYGARALGWWSLHLTQTELGVGEGWEDTGTLWQLLIGWDRGPWYWSTAFVLIVYNVLRAYLTRHLSMLRDAEDRSGYSPSWDSGARTFDSSSRFESLISERKGLLSRARRRLLALNSSYGWAWYAHAYFVRWAFWLAVGSFLFHAVPWLFTEIAVPPGVMD
jgi:uncharacterized protein YjbI with pentapeptide repeats